MGQTGKGEGGFVVRNATTGRIRGVGTTGTDKLQVFEVPDKAEMVPELKPELDRVPNETTIRAMEESRLLLRMLSAIAK